MSHDKVHGECPVIVCHKHHLGLPSISWMLSVVRHTRTGHDMGHGNMVRVVLPDKAIKWDSYHLRRANTIGGALQGGLIATRAGIGGCSVVIVRCRGPCFCRGSGGGAVGRVAGSSTFALQAGFEVLEAGAKCGDVVTEALSLVLADAKALCDLALAGFLAQAGALGGLAVLDRALQAALFVGEFRIARAAAPLGRDLGHWESPRGLGRHYLRHGDRR
mmetsp:Transcript_24261/g.59166  ORF Transcript_24261/g.59166 Transcript_24261/m.59166 type:complete len:218 (+) Transcript_24261:251-904(+)